MTSQNPAAVQPELSGGRSAETRAESTQRVAHRLRVHGVCDLLGRLRRELLREIRVFAAVIGVCQQVAGGRSPDRPVFGKSCVRIREGRPESATRCGRNAKEVYSLEMPFGILMASARIAGLKLVEGLLHIAAKLAELLRCRVVQ